jgi:hypothetical protein
LSGAAASSLPKLRYGWVAHHANWLVTPADTVSPCSYVSELEDTLVSRLEVVAIEVVS